MTPQERRPGDLDHWRDQVEDRLRALEQLVQRFADEVVTRRLVVVDPDGRDRIVAGIVGMTAELRLMATAGPSAPAVLLFANGPARPSERGLGPGVGLQLWAGGEAPVEVALWPDDGRWRPAVHLSER
ncbi:MAG TPA: hypothetical protein VKG43_04130 [Acidimicrobiales bacterium]|nr:hypothetical protein [Acidimicrobiales bacterium]